MKDIRNEVTKLISRNDKVKRAAINGFHIETECKNQNPCKAAVDDLSLMYAAFLGENLGKRGNLDDMNAWLKDNGSNWSWSQLLDIGWDFKDALDKQFTPERLARYVKKSDDPDFSTIVEVTKRRLAAFIENYGRPSNSKTKMINRIQKIRQRNCNLVTENNASYDVETNSICIGLGMVDQKAIVMVVAHELAHSIDPCFSKKLTKETYPFLGIVSCLRGENSARAITKSDVSPPLCDSASTDQVGEAFADFVAAEISPGVMTDLYGVSGESLRSALEKDYSWLWTENSAPRTEFDEHPVNEVRLNNIAFANPRFRQAFGCPLTGGAKYCGETAATTYFKKERTTSGGKSVH